MMLLILSAAGIRRCLVVKDPQTHDLRPVVRLAPGYKKRLRRVLRVPVLPRRVEYLPVNVQRTQVHLAPQGQQVGLHILIEAPLIRSALPPSYKPVNHADPIPKSTSASKPTKYAFSSLFPVVEAHLLASFE